MREELARLLDGLTGTVQLGHADPRWVTSLPRDQQGEITKSLKCSGFVNRKGVD